MTRYALLLALLFPLTACGQDTPHAPEAAQRVQSNEDTISESQNADCLKPKDLIGKKAKDIDTSVFKHFRILGPDTPATMDYRQDRTNILTDKDGVITQIHCG